MSGPSSPLKPPHSFRARHEESLDRIASMGDASQLHSRRSSQQSNGSDGTSPDTPTFSTSCHTRNASTSSLSSSPPMEFESPTFQKPSLPQLPEVAEDVMDRDGSFEYRPAHSFDTARSWEDQDISNVRESLMHSLPNPFAARSARTSENMESFPEPQAKRRKSGEFTFTGLTSRMRLPSLTRRARERRRAQSRGASSEPSSEVTSPVLGRSRSNSRRRNFFGRSDSSEMETDRVDPPPAPMRIATIAEVDQEVKATRAPSIDQVEFAQSPTQMASIAENLEVDVNNWPLPQSPTGITTIAEDDRENHSCHEQESRSVEGLGIRAPALDKIDTTMTHAPFSVPTPLEPVESPLQSPAIDWHTPHTSDTTTLVESPKNVSVISPPLSSKPSLSNLQPQSPPVSPADMPPLLIEEEDEWSSRLGHANYHITPAPYEPPTYTVATVEQLFKDWESARAAFSKHIGRVNTHFGNTSKTYRLTEEKWAETDAEWKRSYARALQGAAQNGVPLPPDTQFEPPPVFRMPEVDGVKFPNLGDDGIVGLMEREERKEDGSVGGGGAVGLTRRPSKKATLKGLIGIGGLQRRGRSGSAPKP